MGVIFNSFYDFQSSLKKSIKTVTEPVDSVEASNLVGKTMVTSIPENLILERKIEELEMDHIADFLCSDGLESRINAGADDLQVGDVIIRSTQYLKAHMVVTNCGGVDFGGLICPYKILTRIQKRLKVEENLAELVKHNKYLASLNISEDEARTV